MSYCPADVEHTYEYVTAQDDGPNGRPTGWYCRECGEPAEEAA